MSEISLDQELVFSISPFVGTQKLQEECLFVQKKETRKKFDRQKAQRQQKAETARKEDEGHQCKHEDEDHHHKHREKEKELKEEEGEEEEIDNVKSEKKSKKHKDKHKHKHKHKHKDKHKDKHKHKDKDKHRDKDKHKHKHKHEKHKSKKDKKNEAENTDDTKKTKKKRKERGPSAWNLFLYVPMFFICFLLRQTNLIAKGRKKGGRESLTLFGYAFFFFFFFWKCNRKGSSRNVMEACNQWKAMSEAQKAVYYQKADELKKQKKDDRANDSTGTHYHSVHAHIYEDNEVVPSDLTSNVEEKSEEREHLSPKKDKNPPGPKVTPSKEAVPNVPKESPPSDSKEEESGFVSDDVSSDE
ncbi:cyclophilin-RNA interacting protein [Reticulomyxa filosa]|uniref:Cyclophilin-RNA interacting protein n=1 Tax=Reticulomyxa filosa TaxID=46433 RepID=X6MWQ8_RETFI|nr:cyclophilin-RNA interacting protein [Reticulomyxa filosa]|eukprot:ETO18274.1 cyclophilin-RNA interacting protein [Reticulomyxa filosa]